MRTANLSRYVYGLLGLLCILSVLQPFPIPVRAQDFDFSGVWNFNDFISGPGAPFWERGTMTVASDGTFTGSGTQSNGDSIDLSGSFSVPSNGIVMSLDGQSSTAQCMTDATNSIMSCTSTLSDGSASLMILTRQASSISVANLAGTWEGGVLSSEPSPSWARVSETINSDGTFTGSYTKSDGTTGGGSGTLSVTPEGVVSCVSGDCGTAYSSFINPSGTVMVGTSGGGTSSQDASLIVLTRQPVSYSIGDLAGLWEVSSIASGPQGPWWQNGILFINTDGTCSLSATASDGSQVSGQTGTVSISSTGVVTLALGNTAAGFVDPNMDVMVLTGTWPDGATREISILTNGYSYATGLSPVVTYGTPPTSPPGTAPTSSPTGTPSTSLPSTGNLPTSPSNTPAHGPGSVGSLRGVSETNQSAAAMQTASSGPTGGSSGPAYTASGGSAPAAATTRPSGVNQASTPATVPGAPTIVVVTPGNSGALVNFKLPSRDGGQPITGCTVTADPGGIKTTRAGSPIQVSGLQNGTSYTFKVTAANGLGSGPSSEASKSVTPGKVPGSPQILSVQAGKGQAEISFKAPASNGGTGITSYTVTSSSGQKVSGAGSPITVGGLSDGTPCTFTVTATNKIGTGPPSSESRSVTPGK